MVIKNVGVTFDAFDDGITNKAYTTTEQSKLSGIDTGANKIPPGTVVEFAGSAAPSGWLICDGSSLARVGTYANLFSAIGTVWGSVDGDHFTIPDFRGISTVGAGTTNRAAGKDAAGNYYAGVLGTYYVDCFQGHIHSATPTAAVWIDSAGSREVPTSSTTANTQQIIIGNPATDGANGTPRTNSLTHSPEAGVNKIIKY